MERGIKGGIYNSKGLFIYPTKLILSKWRKRMFLILKGTKEEVRVQLQNFVLCYRNNSTLKDVINKDIRIH